MKDKKLQYNLNPCLIKNNATKAQQMQVDR